MSKFEKYICKKATRDEVIKRWNYLIEVHLGNNSWIVFKQNTLKAFNEGSMIPYYGILDGNIICEATAYVKPSAFEGDIEDSSGLYNETMAYLAAFRTDKQYEGQGYFSKLYNFVEDDLKEKGYTEFSLGVGPEAVRNIEIYFHLGFREYIKNTIKHDPPKNEHDIPEDEFVNFYKKKI